MKFFKWFQDRGGKIVLSALQTAGIVTVVGVAGIGAISFLGSSGEDATNSPSSYNPGEVVYVAGATGQAGPSGVPSIGTPDTSSRPNESSVRITAKTLNRLDQEADRERIANEMAEYESSRASYGPSPEPTIPSFQGGATEGLNMNANVVNDMGDNPMAAVSGMMGNVQGLMAQAQQQAQEATGGNPRETPQGNASSTPQGAGSLQSVGLTRAGGGGETNSTFSVQNSGKNKNREVRPAPQQVPTGDALAAAQAQMDSVREGMRMLSKPSFGKTEDLGSGKESEISNAGRFGYKTQDKNKDMKDIKWIAARSNKSATNKHRSNTEGARAFLGGEQVSGGMHFVKENFETGSGQSSKDYEASTDVSLRGIGSWGDSAISESEQREQDRNNMKKWFWIALGVSVAATIAIPILRAIPIFGKILALVAATVATVFLIMGFVKAVTYASSWGKTGFSTMAMVVTGLLTGAVWTSYAFCKQLYRTPLYQNILSKLGFSAMAI